MTDAYRVNRKASDEQIIRLNNLGLSLVSMGNQLGCHPSTITQRMRQLGISLTDGRKNIIDYIYENLTEDTKQRLETYLLKHEVYLRDFLIILLEEADYGT